MPLGLCAPNYVVPPSGSGQVEQQACPVAQHAQHLQQAAHSQHAQETVGPAIAVDPSTGGYIGVVSAGRGRDY